MASNPYVNYYMYQSKTGKASGAPNQRGYGFKSFMGGFLPFLKSAGQTLLNTGVGIGSDVIDGHDIFDAVKHRGYTAAQQLADDACDRISTKRRNQSGSGARKKRRVKKCGRKCIKRKAQKRATSLLKKLLKK
ncbi:hypothetical protein HDE_02632 [Halotydeus destructor]|nr:hypothetical protein HDE_02632 [Halotydeus destructor]